MGVFYFTTSWDDGSIQDLKLANILLKYNIKGTFYVCKNFPYKGKKFEYYKSLSPKEIRILSDNFDIGSHTLNHRVLTNIPLKLAKREVQLGQEYLLDIIGHKTKMFCYPEGKYDDNVLKIVKESGFIGARTTEKFNFCTPKNYEDRYRVGISMQVYPFPFRKISESCFYWRKVFQPFYNHISLFKRYPSLMMHCKSWSDLAIATFDKAYQTTNYFHLYGHSWEIERYGMWDELEKFLSYVSSFKSYIKFVDNTELLEHKL